MKLQRIKKDIFIVHNVPEGSRANVVQGKINAWLKDNGLESRVRVRRGLEDKRRYYAKVAS